MSLGMTILHLPSVQGTTCSGFLQISLASHAGLHLALLRAASTTPMVPSAPSTISIMLTVRPSSATAAAIFKTPLRSDIPYRDHNIAL